MDFSCIFFGIIFTIAGILFAFGKGHIHFSAWKNMPREEKDKIDIRPLCRNIGEVIALIGIIFLIKGFWANFSSRCFTAAVIAWFIIAALDVRFISKSDRYRRQ